MRASVHAGSAGTGDQIFEATVPQRGGGRPAPEIDGILQSGVSLVRREGRNDFLCKAPDLKHR